MSYGQLSPTSSAGVRSSGPLPMMGGGFNPQGGGGGLGGMFGGLLQQIPQFLQMMLLKQMMQKKHTETLGTTATPKSASFADLVNPVVNQASTPGSRSMADMPYGRADNAGNITSQFVPPGEGAAPTNEQADIQAAIQSILSMLRR